MTPDWVSIAYWATGIATVLGSVIGTLWVTIGRAMKIAKSLPAPVTKTDIITTDSVAYQQLGATIEGNTVALIQTNMMLTEIITVGKDFTSMMREEREEREFEEEVEKRIKERQKPKGRSTGPRPPRARRQVTAKPG